MQKEETAVADSDNNAVAENDYSVRRAGRADFSAAFALAEAYFQEVDVLVRDTSGAFAGYIEAGSVWLAFADKRPVGCIVLRPLKAPPNSGEIKRLYVQAEHRRQGLAERLLRAVEQHAEQEAYEWLYLDSKDDLANAIRFYQRHGYERCQRYNDNPQATVFMRKRIAGPLSDSWPEHHANLDRLRPDVVIRPFNPEDAADFRRLNEEWIRHYFRLEKKDILTLNEPERWILAPGGYIAMAFASNTAVGCCALLRLDDQSCELAKMAVTPSWQGRGLGRRLLEHAIEHAHRSGVRRLYSETNSKLVSAVRLYESLGFRHLSNHSPSAYERTNVFMELFLS